MGIHESRVEDKPTRRVVERKQRDKERDVSLVWFWGLVVFEVHMPRFSSSFSSLFITNLSKLFHFIEPCTHIYKPSKVVEFSANTCQRSSLDLVPSYLRCLLDLGFGLTITYNSFLIYL